MPKRRGGQKSEKARKGSAEPDAEHSGSEDEPLGEPPLVTPYTRLVEAEAQTGEIVAEQMRDLYLHRFNELRKDIQRLGEVELAQPKRLDAETQTPGQADSVWEAVASIPGYHPKDDNDRVMLSRAAMHKHQIVLQCAQCKAGTLTDVIVVVALCAPLPCKRCGYTLMRPAGQSDKAATAAFKDK